MRRRPLGDTGLNVTELALGTWGLSGDGYGPVPEAEQDKVIERARALGISLFETADCYAHGEMERRLGRLLPDDGKTRIVTKLGTFRDDVPPRKRFDAEGLREAFEKSQERLARDTIDVVLLHNPSLGAVERGEATEALEALRSAGKLRAWGVSAGAPDVALSAISKGAKVVEVAYNVFHTGDVLAIAEKLEAHSVGLLARSVLSYGLLCGHWSPDKIFPEGDHRSQRWTADELRRRVRHLDALRPVVGGPVLTMRAGALRYPLTNPLVSSVVLGPRSTLQLDQLVREAGRAPPYLSDETMEALAARLEDLGIT